MVQGAQFRGAGRTLSTIAGTIFAVSYIGLLGSFAIQMRWLDGRGGGLLPMIYLIATAKGADIGAYLTGRVVGRHKLWPSLSPNKTIEGAIGGLAFSVGDAAGQTDVRIGVALASLLSGAFGMAVLAWAGSKRPSAVHAEGS